MARAAEETNPNLPVVYIKDLEELQKTLPALLEKGDTILIKASHFMQFEKVVSWFAKTE